MFCTVSSPYCEMNSRSAMLSRTFTRIKIGFAALVCKAGASLPLCREDVDLDRGSVDTALARTSGCLA